MKYQKWHIGTAAEGDTALLREAGYPGLLDHLPHADAGYGQGCGPDSKGPCQ